jgi:hypothetical protein
MRRQREISDMVRFEILLISGLILCGCKDMGVQPEPAPKRVVVTHSWLCPGVVGVFFTEGTTLQEAEDMVKDLGLSFQYPPTGTPLNAVISVPVGTEDQWIVQIKVYPIVQTAVRIGVVEMF